MTTRGDLTFNRASSAKSQSGFTLMELVIVIAVIGILTLSALPLFLSYYQNAKVRGAAQVITTYLNQGRQLAIKQNTPICVHITATSMHYHVGGCGGANWVGPGTDAGGNIQAPEGINLTNTADPIFSNLGAATPAATYTVSDPVTGRTLSVIVSASGRITIGP